MKLDPLYTTPRSKWHLCFCCLWTRCCVPPKYSDDPELMEEYKYLNESTGSFFHTTDWEILYPALRGFKLVKEAEDEAGLIYQAYTTGQLDELIAGDTIPSIQQVLKSWRWLNSQKEHSYLHGQF